ncbi:MAG TPA: hypothetical protein VNN17_02410 [Terriglobia bacterium]|nr:hypothetical protein [Terriglobia bacterium]
MNETERQQIRHSAYEERVRRARLAERERCRQIICSPEARQREAFALHIATETDLSPEAARRVLAASPRQIEGPFTKMFEQEGSDTEREIKSILRAAQALQPEKESSQ